MFVWQNYLHFFCIGLLPEIWKVKKYGFENGLSKFSEGDQAGSLLKNTHNILETKPTFHETISQ